MSKSLLVLDAAKILDPLNTFAPGRLIIEGGSVLEVGSLDAVRLPAGAERVDLPGLIVTPGFIDPHIHGCIGLDVMNATHESLNAISRNMARHGTTAFLPTTVSSPEQTLTTAVQRLGDLLSKDFDGARPLGIHLEGPFINAEKRGAHKAANIIAPDVELLRKWDRLSNHNIRLVTLAPELEGVHDVMAVAAAIGATVAMGHSDATYATAAAAADRGLCYAVHTFNAMREFAHREPGIAGLVLSDDRVYAEIIADGVHVNPSVIRIFARAKGRDRILLATDAISAADMPSGCYMLGTDVVNVIDGVCRDADGRLAGSTLSQEIAFKNMVAWTNLSFADALLGLTINPANALRLERKGSLKPGSDADITVLDESFRIIQTYVGGKLAWTNSK